MDQERADTIPERALTPCVRDMVKPEHCVGAVFFRCEVVREECVAVVDN